ncbi:MAG: hypothetical protein RL885_14420 [Planctomycetota bacterium]
MRGSRVRVSGGLVGWRALLAVMLGFGFTLLAYMLIRDETRLAESEIGAMSVHDHERPRSSAFRVQEGDETAESVDEEGENREEVAGEVSLSGQVKNPGGGSQLERDTEATVRSMLFQAHPERGGMAKSGGGRVSRDECLARALRSVERNPLLNPSGQPLSGDEEIHIREFLISFSKDFLPVVDRYEEQKGELQSTVWSPDTPFELFERVAPLSDGRWPKMEPDYREEIVFGGFHREIDPEWFLAVRIDPRQNDGLANASFEYWSSLDSAIATIRDLTDTD